MSGLRQYDELVRAYDDMKWALANGVNRVAGEAARTCLLVAAERCGFTNQEPLLVWAERRVNSHQTLISGSFTELDAKLKALPKEELAELFPAKAGAA